MNNQTHPAERQPAAQWIACADKLPPYGEQVIVYRPLAAESADPLVKASYRTEGLKNVSPQGVEHDFQCWCHPTHWCPIPTVPPPPPAPASQGDEDQTAFISHIKKTVGISISDQLQRQDSWHAALAWERSRKTESREQIEARLNASKNGEHNDKAQPRPSA